MQSELTNSIKDKAYQIGFDLVGIAPAGDFPESQFYKKWLDNGYEASMNYMSNNSNKRENVKNLFPEAKSIISCAVNYNTEKPYSVDSKDNSRGWIARYAWGDDYHLVIKDKLLVLKGFIESSFDSEVDSLVYVDSGPVLERMYGKYSGIGWIGKNTCLINQEIGSWLFLGEVITNIELDYDSSIADRCGTCTDCIDACPTDALRQPYVLDSSRCISYFTIENKGRIPINFREKIDNNIFGCDICQDVCPWNSKAEATEDKHFVPRQDFFNPELKDLVDLDQESFSRLFKKSPIKRAKRKGLIRNVLVAMGNSGSGEFIPFVEKALNDDEPLVRSHAVWALLKLEGESCYQKLKKMIGTETDSEVIKNIEQALEKNR